MKITSSPTVIVTQYSTASLPGVFDDHDAQRSKQIEALFTKRAFLSLQMPEKQKEDADDSASNEAILKRVAFAGVGLSASSGVAFAGEKFQSLSNDQYGMRWSATIALR